MRNTSIAKMFFMRAITDVCWPVSGANTWATERPISTLINSPANWIPAKSILITNPIVTPVIISRKIRMMAETVFNSNTGFMLSTTGKISSDISPPVPIFNIIGIP